jgi:hypothetical protein
VVDKALRLNPSTDKKRKKEKNSKDK